MVDAWGERMPRSLGLLSAVAVSIGITIGSGIFRVPATVAGLLPEPGAFLLCWALGGIMALCGALTVAELAAAMPRSGGMFAYILEGFGPIAAFLFGWAELTVVRAAALGAIATIFAEYLGHFVPLSEGGVRRTAALVIIIVGVLNYIGVRRAAAVLSVTTYAKYAALLALGLLAYTAAGGSWGHLRPLASAPLSLSLTATALIPVMWTYDGWADLAFVGGEVSNPQRTLPLALILGSVGVALVYVVVNLGFLYALPLPAMAGSKLIAATVAGNIPLLAGLGAGLIAALVMVATFSGLNASLMVGARIFYAMGDRGLLFRAVARISPRFESPSVAIAICTALGVIYVLQNNFAQLADKFILGIWPFYVLTVATVFVLRRRRPELPRPYRVWGYPVVPAVFLLASVGMVANALITDPANTGVTLLIIAAGLPVYWVRGRFAGLHLR
ncbi:MAG TPA: amino acid permease [Steroidobacteraceae bacterium]|nr:amino acid permease [Steroidobacteraceae bacterium]